MDGLRPREEKKKKNTGTLFRCNLYLMYNIAMPPEIKTPTSAEIDKALKEFEMQKSGISQTSQDPTSPVITPKDIPKGLDDLGIHFEEDKWRQATPSSALKTPKMIQLIMKYSGGAVKDEKQASYVLFCIVIINISIAAFLVFGGSFSSQEKVPFPPTLPGGILNP